MAAQRAAQCGQPTRGCRVSIPPPEQRETYCHECLTENPRDRRTCVACGARLRHPRDFNQDLADQAIGASRPWWGRVGALVAAGFAGVAFAVLFPELIQSAPLALGATLVVAALAGRAIGRWIAEQANDTSVTRR
jgi:hypothetical protein